MTKEIDWSKAPEDATHYHPAVFGYVEHWYKQDHFCVLGFESDGWRHDYRSNTSGAMVARPVDQKRSIPATAAFPSPGVVLNPGGHNPQQQGAYEGMSLRDYLAAKAMAGCLSSMDPLISYDAPGIARGAYALADAMLAERAK